MRITNDLVFNPHPITGDEQPEVFWGTDAPTTTSTFTAKNIGTYYFRKIMQGHVELWMKVKDDNAADDFSCVKGIISETFTRAQMTDGGSTSGTFTFPQTYPAGAIAEDASYRAITGFIGDTTATLVVGDGTDADRYNTGTPSVFTTDAVGVAAGVPSGTKWHAAAIATIKATITSTADFTNVSAGQVTVALPYHY